jgi:glutamate synthase domain-containing protein 3
VKKSRSPSPGREGEFTLHRKDATSSFDVMCPQERIRIENGAARVNAAGMYYRDLNALLRNLNGNGVRKIELLNVCGQKYIGTGLEGKIEIDVYGTPGNDLGAFMRGTSVVVHGNAQDCCGNTMDGGEIIIHGHAGDVVGYSMRGGRIFIRDDAGYRLGIHMKEYREKKPVIVVGGTAQDFLGEYMAGGVLVVLGLTLMDGERHDMKFVGTGMHGGKMYIRGKVGHLEGDVEVADFEDNDRRLLHSILSEFCNYFDFDISEVMSHEFSKLIPVSYRPYGRLYSK